LFVTTGAFSMSASHLFCNTVRTYHRTKRNDYRVLTNRRRTPAHAIYAQMGHIVARVRGSSDR
jgi:hypothetical protein